MNHETHTTLKGKAWNSGLRTAAFFRGALVILTLAGLCSAQATEKTPSLGADLFTNGLIRRIQIEIKPDALAALRENARGFVPATVSEAGVVHQQVGVRLKGATGSFQPVDQKPALTLDFSRFTAGGTFHGLRRIQLNNAAEDPSYTNEKLGSELFQAAGIPAPRVTRALVELNGRALGLYVLKEGFTEDFLAGHFQKVSGELYEPGTGHDVDEELERNSVTAPFDKERAALKRLAAAAEEKDLSKRWERLERTLDTERFLIFMALEVMLGHRDGYCLARNNYRVYHDFDRDRMLFLPHGMDQLFGTPDLPWQPHLSGAVARAVMETPEGRQGFAATFGNLLTNIFKVEQLTNRIEQLTQEVRPVLSRREFAAVKTEADELKLRIAQRKQNLVEQFNRPPAQPVEFSGGVARVAGWEISGATSATLTQNQLDGVATLHIATKRDCSASWRAKVLLTRGSYRLEGRAKTSGVQPLPSGSRQGASLRVRGGESSETLLGDSQWRALSVEFDVRKPAQEAELVCELRASGGEAWFDLDSLRLVKVKNL